MATMTENSKRVFNYLKEHYGEDITAKQIQEALGLEKLASVTGSVNGLVKKGRAVRTESTTENEEGKKVTIKYISLTEDGLNFDPDADAVTED
jgi:hypothetical protein